MTNFWLAQKSGILKNEKDELKKWFETGILDGVTPNYKKRIAMLLENQWWFSRGGFGPARPDDFQEQMYKRICQLAIKDIFDPANTPMLGLIAFQPILGPTGIVEYLEFKYSTSCNAKPEVITTEDGESSNDDVPEISLCLEKVDVASKTRKLKSEWPVIRDGGFKTEGYVNYEKLLGSDSRKLYLTKDYAASHYPFSVMGIDNEAEMSIYWRNAVSDEITNEIINDLRNNAGTIATTQWHKKDFVADARRESIESLYWKIHEVSNAIHRKTLRGGAAWLIASPEVVAGFCEYYSTPVPVIGDRELTYCGSCCHRWRMYASRSIPKHEILVGYKGNVPSPSGLKNWVSAIIGDNSCNLEERDIDSGYIYSPYVPFALSTNWEDPEHNRVDRQDEQGFWHLQPTMRYAKKLIRPGCKYYGKIVLEDLKC